MSILFRFTFNSEKVVYPYMYVLFFFYYIYKKHLRLFKINTITFLQFFSSHMFITLRLSHKRTSELSNNSSPNKSNEIINVRFYLGRDRTPTNNTY